MGSLVESKSAGNFHFAQWKPGFPVDSPDKHQTVDLFNFSNIHLHMLDSSFLLLKASIFGLFQAEPAEVEICFNRAQQNKTVDPYCGKHLGCTHNPISLVD